MQSCSSLIHTNLFGNTYRHQGCKYPTLDDPTINEIETIGRKPLGTTMFDQIFQTNVSAGVEKIRNQ